MCNDAESVELDDVDKLIEEMLEAGKMLEAGSGGTDEE